MTSTTSYLQRFGRLTCLAMHLAKGLVIAAFRYRNMSAAMQRATQRNWSQRLLQILHVELECVGAPRELPACCLLASNHISWLDIFLINAVVPAVFVAKSDVARWPLIGRLCTSVGTLYIERGSKSGARRANEKIAHTLAAGQLVAVCPEGTTTLGRELLPFHAALFQPAVDVNATVLPVALRYFDEQGELCETAGYVGEDTLLDSFWHIVSTPRISAVLRFLAPIDIAGMTRRQAARAAEAVIAKELGVPVPGPVAGKHAGPRDESP